MLNNYISHVLNTSRIPRRYVTKVTTWLAFTRPLHLTNALSSSGCKVKLLFNHWSIFCLLLPLLWPASKLSLCLRDSLEVSLMGFNGFNSWRLGKETNTCTLCFCHVTDAFIVFGIRVRLFNEVKRQTNLRCCSLVAVSSSCYIVCIFFLVLYQLSQPAAGLMDKPR